MGRNRHQLPGSRLIPRIHALRSPACIPNSCPPKTECRHPPACQGLSRFVKVHEPETALREVLANGPMNSQTAVYEMASRGFSEKQTRCPREKLVVAVKRAGCGKLMHSMWALPGIYDTAQPGDTPAPLALPAADATVLKVVKVQPDAGTRRRSVESRQLAPGDTAPDTCIP